MATRTFFLVLATIFSVNTGGEEILVYYPETERIDHTDVYHGTGVADPYRWLEDDVRESDAVADWVTRQNVVTESYLGSLENRAAIKKRLTELWNYESYTTPFKAGGRYYFRKNNGLQNQSVLYVQRILEEEPKVLIDPNTWSKDGTVALLSTAFSDDGKYIAYGVSSAGSDWQTWKVREIESGVVLEDTIEWVKYSGATWDRGSKGFYYGRFDEPEEGAAFQGTTYFQKLYYHRVGTEQSEDVLVYDRPDQPKWGFGASTTEDGRYLVITIWKGTDNNCRITYRDLRDPESGFVDLIDNFEEEYSFLGNDGPTFYFRTGLDAPRHRVVSIDINTPEKRTEIIDEREDTLRSVSLLNNTFIASYLQDAKTQVVIFAKDGQELREIDFPGIGSAAGFGGRQDDTETFYAFSSFTTPPSLYRYDPETNESFLIRQAEVDVSLDDYEVTQVFYESKDGTHVPMFIVHKHGLALDGSHPTLLYGYGGFNLPLTPSFAISRVAWLELGGVYAVANLRGGGEYGEAWHEAGTKLQKQNVFDDFIAAAEWLIAEGYTSREHLAIQGRSNGGLLVGAAMTQRPELFGACLPGVGVMDMLRFDQFTAGRFWVDDYGSSENPDEFKALYSYSPYHNIEENTAYPPTLVTTADTDDRVVPGHSFKFAAALQRAQSDGAPVLIRIETRAGHGAGKPTTKRIEEIADESAFALHNISK